MFSLGSSSVNTQNQSLQDAIQDNDITINLGSGELDNYGNTEQTASTRAASEQTKREDFGLSAAVALAPNAQAEGGEVTRSGDTQLINKLDDFWSEESKKKYTPYLIVFGITSIFMTLLYKLLSSSKKGK